MEFNWKERGYKYASPEYYKLWREVNAEKSREYHRTYDSKMYKLKPDRERARRKRYQEKYPHRIKANRLLNQAVKLGTIIKQSCETCGSPKAVAHHSDYTRPLDVLWLCDLHHKQWHRENQVIDV